MSREARRLADYLKHLLRAIDRIERYTEGITAQAFLQNDMVQDAVIRNVEIVGEACRNIERSFPEFAAAHPELPLKAAFEMRNALAHGYFAVDPEIVWRTVQRDLPALRQQVHGLLNDPG